MKRRYWLLLILLLATPALTHAKESPPPKQQHVYPFTGKVTGNKVRLRSAPHLEGTIIAELNRDDYIKIIGEQAGFFVVAPPTGMKMYVYRTYVFDQTIDASNVNVRLAPSLEAPIAAQLHAGDKVFGKPSAQNPKWIEIDPPATAKLYVSKEYVDNIGGPDYLIEQTSARETAQNFLLESYKEAEGEMKKTFDQMRLEPLIERVGKTAANWQSMPEHKKRAEELKVLLEETHKSRHVAWLEEQAATASLKLEAKEKERANFERRIQELEETLHSQKERLMSAIEIKATESAPLSLELPKDDAPLSRFGQVELSLQNQWLAAHTDATVENYQKAQNEESLSLKGVVAPYKATSKKAPGEYLLLVNDVPVAFLYSPFVDLNVAVGKEVSLTAVRRDNNHFAYPAYCIIQVKHGNP